MVIVIYISISFSVGVLKCLGVIFRTLYKQLSMCGSHGLTNRKNFNNTKIGHKQPGAMLAVFKCRV